MRQRIWQIFVIILVLVNLISAGGVGTTPALAANPAAPAFALSVTPEVVDNNAISGQYSSIALDAEGVAHIAYFYDDNDGTPDGILMMASRHGGTWLSEPVDGASITGVTPSIAIDEDGMAHIAYYDQTNGDLRYAKQRTPDGWDYHTVDSPGNVGANCALALDSLQRPHIAYRDATNSTLKYATFNGTTWQISTIPGTSDFTYDSSIGLGLTSADLPRIAYRQMNGQIPKALGYVQFNGTSWSVEAALTSTAVGDRFSLVMGAGDVPHISFMDTSVGLKYMKKDGAWSTPETVVASVNAGSLNDLALDPAGRPRIVYLDATAMPYLLKIAYKDGATWRL